MTIQSSEPLEPSAAPAPGTDDLRIRAMTALSTPATVIAEYPLAANAAATVADARRAIQDILHGRDERLVVVIGPCSVHDPEAAMDYAERLVAERQRHADALEVVMRVYFEKPRTTVGWKGIHQRPGPQQHLPASTSGLHLARQSAGRTSPGLGLPTGMRVPGY